MKAFLTILTSCWLNYYVAQPYLTQIFQSQEWQNAVVSISVKEVVSRQSVFEHNSHISLVPASTFKLLTTIIGLEKLGADFHFKTEVYARGEIKNNTLYGDIIIKGYGDPTLESRFFNYPKLNAFTMLLNNKDIKIIQGKVILDNSYSQTTVNDNWAWEDINNYYAAIPYSFNIYDNQYHIYLKSENENAPVQLIKITPQYNSAPLIEITDNMLTAKTGGDNAYIYGDPVSYTKRLKGSIPPFQKTYSIEGALPDPVRMFAQELLSEFSKNKLSVFNTIISNTDTINYSSARLLGTIQSPPLSEIIQLTNMHSINLFAESILTALGKGNSEKGKEVIKTYLKHSGTNVNEVNIDDGCGLSRLNLLSADALNQLLLKIYHTAHQSYFLKSLPVAGESGTMKRYTDTAPLKGNLKCKTGYIQGVRTYAGYLKTKSGKILSFCLFFNNFTLPTEKIKQTSKIFFETLYENF